MATKAEEFMAAIQGAERLEMGKNMPGAGNYIDYIVYEHFGAVIAISRVQQSGDTIIHSAERSLQKGHSPYHYNVTLDRKGNIRSITRSEVISYNPIYTSIDIAPVYKVPESFFNDLESRIKK